MRTLDWLALVLIILGGLNWGIVALTGYNFVGGMFGSLSTVARVIYGIIGLSALYMIGVAFTKLNQCSYNLLHGGSRV